MLRAQPLLLVLVNWGFAPDSAVTAGDSVAAAGMVHCCCPSTTLGSDCAFKALQEHFLTRPTAGAKF
jgi:hypothetical protein